VTWGFLFKQKSELSSAFIQFVTMTKHQFEVNVKRIRYDSVKDYFNLEFNSFCHKEGIIRESSCVNIPEQNEIVQKKNSHLLEQTKALLFQYHLPKKFWGKPFLLLLILAIRYSLKS